MANGPKKGFIQINIAGYIWRPMTEAEKAQPDAMGDFIEVQPIMYDVFVPVIPDNATPAGVDQLLKEIPEGMLTEVHAVLEEIVKFIRLHKPAAAGIVPVGVRDQNIQQAPKPSLLDASGNKLTPTKH